MENYADLMFTQAVQDAQERDGTREKYAAAYPGRTRDTLGPDEVAFLQSRTTLYMASVGETGWPYVQHRGGPRGFLKVLDGTTLGFADYRGNRQHISEGNLQGNARVSLFAMDYARKARLKLQGHATMIDAADDPELAQRLHVDGQGRVERLVTIQIAAMDWNCPQFITPRLDTDEISQLVGPEMDRLQARVRQLEAELAQLKGL